MPLHSSARTPIPPTPPSMATTLTLAERYSTLPQDILLVGPTGSGKGHLAEYIHRTSGRSGAFISISGGQLIDSLWSSQLFGHYAGAFTGARGNVRGSFALAAGGTLFLDELHHWDVRLQSALLRPLESRRFTPLGSDREITANCRILFATTMNPDDLVERGVLLPDLRYRLPALVLEIPPLSARRNEILTFVDHFVAKAVASFGWDRARFRWRPCAIRALLLHDWPGNVRQLARVLTASLARLGPEPSSAITAADLGLPTAPRGRLSDLLDPSALQAAVAWAMAQAGGSRTAAAELLDVHRNTFAAFTARAASLA